MAIAQFMVLRETRTIKIEIREAHQQALPPALLLEWLLVGLELILWAHVGYLQCAVEEPE